MSYCTNCGSPAEERFCPQCGAEVAPQPAGTGTLPPAPAIQPAAPGPVAPVLSKKSPLLWILGGCLVMVVIGIAIAVGAGFFVFHKAREAGFDQDLMRRNPALAVTKMLSTFNPDIEVVSVDEDKGVITVREKSTGKTMTMDFEDVKNGKIVFTDQAGEKVAVEAEGGDSGSFTMKSKDGTVTAGPNWSPPDWLPVYTGARVENGTNTHSDKEDAGAGSLTTKDSVEAVLKFYEEALRNDGFEVTKGMTASDGKNTMATISGQSDESKRNVNVTAVAADGSTKIHLVYSAKN